MNPTVDVNNFELRPALIALLKRDQFAGHPSENPNMHLHNFLTNYDTSNLNGVSIDAIWLRPFPFSMRDRARDWLQNEEPNAFATCDTLSKAFWGKYFPPGKTVKLSVNITTFTQLHGESLYKA